MMTTRNRRQTRLPYLLLATGACFLLSKVSVHGFVFTRERRIIRQSSCSFRNLALSVQPNKRFSQSAHSSSPPKRRRKQQQQQRPSSSSSSSSAQPPSSSRYQQQSRQQRPNRIDTQKKSSKSLSIDDLEQRLTAKWGTDASAWTAQDVLNDTDEYEFEGNEPLATDNFRARPVRDPWARPTSPSTETEKEASDASMSSLHRSPTNIDGGLSNNKSSPLSAFGGAQQMPSSFPLSAIASQPETTKLQNKKQRTKSKTSQSTALNFPSATQEATVYDFLDLPHASSLTVATKDDDDHDEIVGRSTTKWQDLGIHHPTLLQNLQNMQCESPLDIQVQALESIHNGTDTVIGSYTGSGKTLAFLVPILSSLLSERSLQMGTTAVVVCPGRELASQIVQVCRALLQDTGLKVQLAIGGTTFSRNVQQLRKNKPQLIVGTPGRLAELIVGKDASKPKLALKDLQYLVLDEFDALLEYKPHRDPTQSLLTTLRRKRHFQTILCSATALDLLQDSDKTVRVQSYLNDNYRVVLADASDPLVVPSVQNRPRVSTTVLHGVVHAEHRRYVLDLLRKILHTNPVPQQILVFCESARRVKIVVDKLAEMGVLAAALSGDEDKTDRAEVAKALREGFVGLVVTTELAARGLDAPLLTHMINLDLPTDSSHYAHRAGRVGRNGRPGVVINLTTDASERKVPFKFSKHLGVPLHTVVVKNSKLNIVPDS